MGVAGLATGRGGAFGGVGAVGFSTGMMRSWSSGASKALAKAASSSTAGVAGRGDEKVGAPRAGVSVARAPIDEIGDGGVGAGLRASDFGMGAGRAVGESTLHSSSIEGSGG